MPRPNFAVTLVILIHCSLVAAQISRTDSLKSILPGLTGRERIDVLNRLAYDLKFNEQDAAISFGREALQLAREQRYPEGEVKAILNIGIVHDIRGNSDSSEWYFTKAYEYAKAASLGYYEANAVNNLGMMNWNRGNFQEAIDFFYQALKLYEQQENRNGISKATSNIGLIYQELSQWEQALTMNLRAYELRLEEGNPDLIARSCNNIGICYKSLGDYDQAMNYYSRGIDFASEANSTGVLGSIYTNMAVLYQLRGDPFNALEYQLKSLKLREGRDMFGALADHNNLSGIYYELGRGRNGIEHGLRAVNIADSLKNIGHTDETFYNLGLNYMLLNNQDSARYYFDRAFIIRDSIYSELHAEELAALEADYEKEKKESEIARLTSEAQIKDLRIKHSQNLTIIVILAAMIILVTGGFAINRIRMKQRAVLAEERRRQQQARYTAVLAAEEQERKRIARELHDGLGQILATASLNISALEGEPDPKKNKALDSSRSLIDNAVDEVRAISHNLMPNALVSLGLIPAINEQLHKIRDSGRLQVHADFPEWGIELDETRSICLYRAMQEILNNSLKYSGAENIWVRIENHSGKLTTTIKDDGKGFDPAEIDKSPGIGWKNIISRVELANGIVEVETEPGKGTLTRIIIPV